MHAVSPDDRQRNTTRTYDYVVRRRTTYEYVVHDGEVYLDRFATAPLTRDVYVYTRSVSVTSVPDFSDFVRILTHSCSCSYTRTSYGVLVVFTRCLLRRGIVDNSPS